MPLPPSSRYKPFSKEKIKFINILLFKKASEKPLKSINSVASKSLPKEVSTTKKTHTSKTSPHLPSNPTEKEEKPAFSEDATVETSTVPVTMTSSESTFDPSQGNCSQI